MAARFRLYGFMTLEVHVKRSHHLAAAAVLAVMTTALVAGAASAHGGGGRERHRYEALPGVLEASGDGIAAASGKLTLKLCADDGLLITKGGVSLEEGAAYEDSVSWLGLNVYFGFAGCAAIGPEEALWSGFSTGGGGRGKTAALAVGTGLELRAVGSGVAFVKGEGEWAKDQGESGEWTDEPTILKIGGKKRACDVEAMHGGGSGCATPEPDPTEEPSEDQ
jgi:hypothetical protein